MGLWAQMERPEKDGSIPKCGGWNSYGELLQRWRCCRFQSWKQGLLRDGKEWKLPKDSSDWSLIIYSNCHLGENNVILSLNEIAGLPAGTYCNIIDDCATSVTVDASGMGAISITNYDEPILALCPGCPTLPTLPTSGPTASTTPGTTLPTTPLPTLGPGAKRTVIFIQKQTNPGQDLFIRGGIDATVRPPCTDITSSCSIPFKVPIQHAIRLIYNELH